MTPTATVLLALLSLATLPVWADSRQCPDPGSAVAKVRERYGDRIEFEVRRNGKPVGRHVTSFESRDGYLVVKSDMRLSIRILFIEAYQYHYAATEYWCGGRLVRLASTVDDNGTQSVIEAAATGEEFEVDGPQGRQVAPLGIFSTNHWHAGVVRTHAVVNTLTGSINQVVIKTCSTPQPNGEGPPGAHCYDYTGDLVARAWYDRDERWVGLAFDGKDGSRFEYVCTNCATPGRKVAAVTQN